MYGLPELVQRFVRLGPEGIDGFFSPVAESYCSPGYWVAMAARGRSRGARLDDLQLSGSKLGYAKAIQIESALGTADTYPYDRRNVGANYSPLVVLSDVEETNHANASINGCIRNLFPSAELKPFVVALCDVVGDMHDNVWSHGDSTGISMAQKWDKPHSRDGAVCLEFALADCGYGFLDELKRSGIATKEGIAGHQAAIRWCIQKGHSSKKRDDDGWTQRLPEDVMGNPLGPIARVKSKENNHLGLGLYKLTELVKAFSGELWLVSGDAMLHLNAAKGETYSSIPCPWKGVALACQFTTDSVLKQAKRLESSPDELDRLLGEVLGGN